MNIKDLYDAVKREAPCTQDEFLTFLDQTVRTFIAKYKFEYVIYPKRTYAKPRRVDEEIPVYDEYYPALLNNVLFLITKDSDRKTDSVEEAGNAYRAVWSHKLRGQQLVDRGYYDV